MSLAKRFSICGTPLFLTALFGLLINDLYLKSHFPSFLTGKLSDFSGLIVLPLLLFSFFPRQVKPLAVTVTLLFIWWKAPYSEGFIGFANSAGLRISRVVDYTDLLALLMIPIAVRVFNSHRSDELMISRGRRFVLAFSVVASCLAVAGTSLAPYTRAFLIQDPTQARILSEEDVEEVLATLAESPEFECRDPGGNPGSPDRICNIDGIWFTYEIQDGRVSFRVEELLPFFGSGRRVMRNTDQFVEKIKTAFAGAIEGLEYVEPLVDRHER